MAKGLECEWMSLKLKSPYIMASLTLMSNVDLGRHIEYYKKVSMAGAGAIVLPSINPEFLGECKRNVTEADSLIFNTGLHREHRMGFAVLGPTVPNIISLNYGLSLAKELKKEIKETPIIASVVNIGEEEKIIKAVEEIGKIGVDGIELNFSCPNVKMKNKRKCVLTNELLKRIRKVVKQPISLKIKPYEDYSLILESLDGEIDGLTLSNAYIGLVPPEIEGAKYSPFERREEWAPCGVYGPFERMLTFYQLYKYHDIAEKKRWNIACVGGIVSIEEAIQAILLGADVVQLSSAIAWHGTRFFQESNRGLSNYLKAYNFEDVNSIRGSALPYIKSNVDELSDLSMERRMKVDEEKCKKCKECKCCNRLCIAISQKENGIVKINRDLCSGCKWCYYMCVNGAITEDNPLP